MDYQICHEPVRKLIQRQFITYSHFLITCLAPCAVLYAQCGGIGWTGQTQCCSGSTCTYGNDYYHQCLPGSGGSTSSGTTSRATPPPSSGNDGRQDGVTTRYWDCCKASCGWAGKASVSNPVKTCARDGVTAVDVNTQSGCNGGSGYMCSNQQPWNVSSTLSYGYAAAYITVSDRFFFKQIYSCV